jgi:hypothetical protein
MDAVAHRAASADDWEQIRTRVLAGDAPIAVDLRRRRAGWLAAAAVLLVAAAIGAALVAAQRSSDPGRVHTTQLPQGSAGGWYIPEGLPQGWKPLRVTSDVETQPCLCRSAIWREVGGDGWVQFRTSAFPEGATVEQPDPEDLTIDLGGGFRGGLIERTGVEAAQAGDWDLGWSDQHHYGGVAGSGISSDRAAAIGRALVADPERLDIPVDGARYELESDEVSTKDRVNASIQVEMRRPDGGTAIYSLRAPGTYRSESPEADWNRIDLPGQDLPVETWVEQAYTGPSHGYRPWTNYRGEWEGATMTAPGSANVKDGEFSPNAEQVALLVGSLRPATLDEWRAFVGRAKEHMGRVLEIESVAALVLDSSAASTSTTVPARRVLEGPFPDGKSWSVEADPEHGLCALLDETNVGCDDVGPVVPADADPSTARWGLTEDRWLAYGFLPEGAVGVVITPLDGATRFSDVQVDRTTRLWGAGGENPDHASSVAERFRIRYKMADGTLIDAPQSD